MKDYWYVWERGFASDYCDYIINKALELPVHKATVGFDEHSRVDINMRRSNLRWISRGDFSWESVFIVVENFIHTANNNAFGFDVTRIAEMQFTEYDEGDEGKYDWHEDLDWLDNGFSQRKVSIVIQLTEGDEYEGGELELGGTSIAWTSDNSSQIKRYRCRIPIVYQS